MKDASGKGEGLPPHPTLSPEYRGEGISACSYHLIAVMPRCDKHADHLAVLW